MVTQLMVCVFCEMEIAKSGYGPSFIPEYGDCPKHGPKRVQVGCPHNAIVGTMCNCIKPCYRHPAQRICKDCGARI